MAVLTREELNQRMADRFGETEDENDLSFMEDITDTFNDLQTTANDSKLKELQQDFTKLQDDYSALKKKYRDRFFMGNNDSGDEDLLQPTPDPEPKVLTFDGLFKQGD